MLIGQPCDAPPARCAADKSQLHEVGLINILNGYGFLSDGGGERVYSDRSSAVKFDDGLQHAAIDIIQTQIINFQTVERVPCRGGVYLDLALYLCKIPHTLKQAVSDTRRSA